MFSFGHSGSNLLTGIIWSWPGTRRGRAPWSVGEDRAFTGRPWLGRAFAPRDCRRVLGGLVGHAWIRLSTLPRHATLPRHVRGRDWHPTWPRRSGSSCDRDRHPACLRVRAWPRSGWRKEAEGGHEGGGRRPKRRRTPPQHGQHGICCARALSDLRNRITLGG